MAIPDELYDLLEHIQAQLPHDLHKTYEEAADRALQHHSRKHGFWWWENQGPHEEGIPAIFALVIGLIGGAALMYLFDPERGAGRRAMLSGEVHKLAEEAEVEGRRARDEGRKLVSEAEEVAGKVRGEAHKLAGEAEEVAGKARGEARKLVDEAEDEAHKLRGQANKAAGDGSSAADSAAKQVKSAADDVKKQVDDKTTPPKA